MKECPICHKRFNSLDDHKKEHPDNPRAFCHYYPYSSAEEYYQSCRTYLNVRLQLRELGIKNF